MKLALILILSISVLAGCKKNMVRHQYSANPLTHAGTPNDSNYLTTVNEIVVIDVSKLPLDISDAKGLRNAIIARGISLSDNKCADHKTRIMSTAAGWNLITGTTSILLAATASVITDPQQAAALAASAAATSGVQALGNKEVYANQMGQAIIRSIDVAREKKRATLTIGMGKPAADYPLAIALGDLDTYHDSCSMAMGLSEMTKALDNRKQTKDEIILNMKALNEIKTEASKNAEPATKTAIENEYKTKVEEITTQLMNAKE